MYIIAIAWLYVTVLMALTETSVVAGVLSFVIYGLAPTALLLWLFGRPVRRRNSADKTRQTASEQDQPDQ
jgi:membrane protein implicated in regulation of membrane protease activity